MTFKNILGKKITHLNRQDSIFFLLTENLMPSILDVSTLPSYRSDHSSVVLSVKINEFKKRKGLWKFNTSLLKDRD